MTDHVVNGWRIYMHPAFASQLGTMSKEVEKARSADPVNYVGKRCSKLLLAARRMAFEVIPDDPASPRFRLGATLGESRKHWFRAKFAGQYRLFFRYSAREKIIVLAWINDGETLRAYGSKTDAYAVFSGMLNSGNPSDDWNELIKQSS